MSGLIPPATSNAAIGVFDSGVGGLSVLREIRKLLPAEDLLYVADSGHAPYGERGSDYILARSLAIADFFAGRGVKAMVIACNTATAAAAPALRERHALPIIAMEPALKPAAGMTRSGVVGVLATSQTLASERFSSLADRYGRGVKILVQPCPGFVEQVEKVELDGPQATALVSRYVSPLLEQGADTLVLGCTHYPFLTAAIRAVAGPEVVLVDPAPAVARELQRRLASTGLLRSGGTAGGETFWSSGAADEAARKISRLWGRAVAVSALPEAGP